LVKVLWGVAPQKLNSGKNKMEKSKKNLKEKSALHYLIKNWDDLMPKGWFLYDHRDNTESGPLVYDELAHYEWNFEKAIMKYKGKEFSRIGRLKGGIKNLDYDEVRAISALDFKQIMDLEIILKIGYSGFGIPSLFDFSEYSWSPDLEQLGKELLNEKLKQSFSEDFSARAFGKNGFCSRLEYELNITGSPTSIESLKSLKNSLESISSFGKALNSFLKDYEKAKEKLNKEFISKIDKDFTK